MEKKANAGYVIKDEISVMGSTYVLGHNPNPTTPAPFVTWAQDGPDSYRFGHYFVDEASARQNLFSRAFAAMPEKDVEEIIHNNMPDAIRDAIAEQARKDLAIADIESCLDDALDNLDLGADYVARADLAEQLLKNEDFISHALHSYYKIDHSAENEALTDSLESLLKEHHAQFGIDLKPAEPEAFYFTFGTSESFPFQKGYVKVLAENMDQAIDSFRHHFPDRTPGIWNFSDCYTSESFALMNMPKDWRICHAIIQGGNIDCFTTPNKPLSDVTLDDIISNASQRAEAQSKQASNPILDR